MLVLVFLFGAFQWNERQNSSCYSLLVKKKLGNAATEYIGATGAIHDVNWGGGGRACGVPHRVR